jgi:hypothetical protein
MFHHVVIKAFLACIVLHSFEAEAQNLEFSVPQELEEFQARIEYELQVAQRVDEYLRKIKALKLTGVTCEDLPTSVGPSWPQSQFVHDIDISPEVFVRETDIDTAELLLEECLAGRPRPSPK